MSLPGTVDSFEYDVLFFRENGPRPSQVSPYAYVFIRCVSPLLSVVYRISLRFTGWPARVEQASVGGSAWADAVGYRTMRVSTGRVYTAFWILQVDADRLAVADIVLALAPPARGIGPYVVVPSREDYRNQQRLRVARYVP